jgi:hypothetical protein
MDRVWTKPSHSSVALSASVVAVEIASISAHRFTSFIGISPDGQHARPRTKTSHHVERITFRKLALPFYIKKNHANPASEVPAYPTAPHRVRDSIADTFVQSKTLLHCLLRLHARCGRRQFNAFNSIDNCTRIAGPQSWGSFGVQLTAAGLLIISVHFASMASDCIPVQTATSGH